MDKKISVIIPIYNAEKFLQQTLDCIRFQSHTNLEIICVLDCPTDSSVQIVEAIAKEDKRVKLVYNSYNMGAALTRNLGVQSATGEYIHFMDSDDLLSPDFYKNMLAAAVEADADVSACSVYYEGKPLESIWFLQNEVVCDSDKIKKTKVISAGWAWRYLIKRDFWNHYNLLFPDLPLFEDTPVMLQMIYYANKVALCPQAIYSYKNRPASLVNSRSPHEDPKEERRKKSFKIAQALCMDFMREHKIKHPSKFEQKLRKHLTLRKKNIICRSAPVEYGKANEKISVIIPIYNAENFLQQTLNCIRFQSYKNLEIICVLDYPIDGSEEIVERIAREDVRIKVIKSQKNIGHANARNVGAQSSTGGYLHFMDSDDFISPNFYEEMLKSIQAVDADVSACSVFFEKKPKRSIWFTNDEILYGEEKIKKTEVTIQGWAWRYLIKKSFWVAHNFSFPNLLMKVDSPVMIPMIYYANKVAFCSQAVYFYKNRENSVLNRKNFSAEVSKKRRRDRLKSRQLSTNFIRKYNIKGNSTLQYIRSSLAGKMVVCKNVPVEYGKIDKKISVIIPIYNVENYLKVSIDSVRFQTYKNLEIICVLDCPTDNCAEIARKIAQEDNRVKLVEHSKNMGLPAARNSGVENATGEYIHFMDSDDLLSPDFYETLINAAEKADADVAACSVFYEKKTWRSIWFQKNEVLSKTNSKIKKTHVAFQGWAWRYLIKKRFWDERKFSFPNLVPMEDKPVMIPMIYYANKVALCSSAVYFYKNRENSILNKRCDAIREKQRSENRRKARKIFRNFMHAHKIRRPSKWWYYLKKYFA
jgi:glycosyltransferase involved in cell wall biosynthesis